MTRNLDQTKKRLNLANTHSLALIEQGKSLLIQLSDGLSVGNIIANEDPREVAEERLQYLREAYKDCQRKMARYKAEAEDIKNTLSHLKKPERLGDTEGAEMWIGRMVAETDRQLNVQKGFDEKQIDFIASDIKSTYPTLMFKELAYVFRRGITGHYGKTDFRFDGQIVHVWIRSYLEEKNCIICEKKRQNDERQKAMSYIGRESKNQYQ